MTLVRSAEFARSRNPVLESLGTQRDKLDAVFLVVLRIIARKGCQAATGTEQGAGALCLRSSTEAFPYEEGAFQQTDQDQGSLLWSRGQRNSVEV